MSRHTVLFLLICLLRLAHADDEMEYASKLSGTALPSGRLIWSGDNPPAVAETKRLLEILDPQQNLSRRSRLEKLSEFIQEFPDSSWSPSLESHLGALYYEMGRWSSADEHWQKAWNLSKDAEETKLKTVRNITIAKWSRLLARLGRVNKLNEILPEEVDGPLESYLSHAVQTSREALGYMKAHPETSYRCGVFALANILGLSTPSFLNPAGILSHDSPIGGFSVQDLLNFAKTEGAQVLGVVSTNGAVPIPSVVHWKVNHYAAVTKREGDRIYLVDPTFGGEFFLDIDDFRNEVSGIYITLGKDLVDGCRALEFETARSTFGKGGPNVIDDDMNTLVKPRKRKCNDKTQSPGEESSTSDEGCDECGDSDGDESLNLDDIVPEMDWAMGGEELPQIAELNDFVGRTGLPNWNVVEPFISTGVHDRPLAYKASRGNAISFGLHYKGEDAEPEDPALMMYSGVGPHWYMSWRSYIQYIDTTTCILHPEGGGVLSFKNGQRDNHSLITIVWTNSVYLLINPDGSQRTYGLSVTNTGGFGTYINSFLTKTEDRFGNPITLILNVGTHVYGKPMVRVMEVRDVDGRTNSLTYGLAPPRENYITRITDPFGRHCDIEYTNTPYLGDILCSITDVAGLKSQFDYDNSGHIKNMVTPYGRTTFETIHGSGSYLERSVRVITPGGRKYLYLYKDAVTGVSGPPVFDVVAHGLNDDGYQDTNNIPSTVPFGSVDNLNVSWRNSWFWGPKQYSLLTTTNIASFIATDYSYGRLKHWLHPTNTPLSVGSVLSFQREPSINGSALGKIRWFDYYGKPTGFSWYEGTNQIPNSETVVMPDGTVTWWVWERNEKLQPTSAAVRFVENGSSTTRTMYFEYTNSIDLARIQAPDGSTVFRALYDAQHRLKTNWNALNQSTVRTYNTVGQLESITFPSGLIITNDYYSTTDTNYHQRGYLKRVVKVGFSTNDFTYTNGLIKTATTPLGLVKTYERDALGRISKILYPDTSTFQFSYGLVGGVSYPGGTGGTNILDLTAIKNRAGAWTYVTRNADRKTVWITNSVGAATSLERCVCGGLASIIRGYPDGNTNNLEVTLFDYDSNGRLKTEIRPDLSSVQYGYDSIGRLIAITNGFGKQSLVYNNINQLVEVSNPNGVIFSASYDVLERLKASKGPGGVLISNVYDALSRITDKYVNGTLNDHYAFDNKGLQSYTDPTGRTVTYDRDSLSRASAVIQDGSLTNRFDFDAFGNTIQLTDPKGHITKWLFDSEARFLAKTNHIGTKTAEVSYNTNHLAKSVWTPEHGSIVYLLDAVGRPTNIVTASSLSIGVSYDNFGRLSGMSDSIGTTKYTYSKNGKMASENGPWTADTLSYTYFTNSPVRKAMEIDRPNRTAWVQNYSYDNGARLQSVISPAGTFTYGYFGSPIAASPSVRSITFPNTLITTNALDSYARITNTTIKNVSSVIDKVDYVFNASRQLQNAYGADADYYAYSYDSHGQLYTATHRDSLGSVLPFEDLVYTYDNAGNLSTRSRGTFVQSFSADDLNQLATASRTTNIVVAGETSLAVNSVSVNASNATLFAQHEFGVSSYPISGGTVSLVATATDASGRVATITSSAAWPTNVTFVYDRNGNLTYDGRRYFGYDEFDQLSWVIVSNTVTKQTKSEFIYDGMGRRRIRREFDLKNSAWAQSDEVRYLYDGSVLVEERDRDNVARVTYTTGMDLSLSRQGAGGVGGVLARTEFTAIEPESAYFFHDSRGNVSTITDKSARVVGRFKSDPFGNTTGIEGALKDRNLLRHSGKELHPASGLIYYGFRFYDPSLQRWLNQDPIGEKGGVNLYGFVGNNPLRWVDPYGLDYGDWWDARTWFNSGFTDSWYDSANSIGEGLGNALALNWDGLGDAYDSGVLGQTVDAGPITKYGTRAALGTASVCVTVAGGLIASEFLASRGLFKLSEHVTRQVTAGGERYWSEIAVRNALSGPRLGNFAGNTPYWNWFTTAKYSVGEGEVVLNLWTRTIVHYLPY